MAELTFKGVTKRFGAVTAVDAVSMDIASGEFVSLVGASGCGKTTLLRIIAGFTKSEGGELTIDGRHVQGLPHSKREVGFVFQSYNLIPQLTVSENIEVPLQYQGKLTAESRDLCIQLAEMVGLGDRLNHRPTELSGGQQQRVAIARSLVNDPYFILADEATGNLDSKTTNEILTLFEKLNQQGKTIIMITHEKEVAGRTRRILQLRDGLIEFDKRTDNAALPG